ncbi:rod shape-determining protein [Haloplasma contractile]|uniref:Cell shape-determining protein MreB n=1 Tax=Haloplasma contractile SSD-17B TaxID=1033810 RepID=U2DQI2_9MOLU|nr:rod shape-determining protein [Haloplasma contractile]ERJ10877.1 dihydrolipoamide dehydrogenase protein [Haloplasma contractile SSD-17B]
MANKKMLNIGIDLGTTNILVYVSGQGVIFNEPSVVAFDVDSGEVIAGGQAAYNMVGKTHGKIRVARPLREGVISDMEAAKALLKYIFLSLKNRKDLRNSYCVICCPSEVTHIERDAMRDLALQMGIGEVLIEEEIKAGAIGSGIDIYSPEGSMVIDIGGGTTDVGVLSLGDVVLSQSIRVAGNYIDQIIVGYIHKSHNLVIGQKTAEKAKIETATLLDHVEFNSEFRISGRDLVTGLPRAIVITSEEVRELLQPVFEEIGRLVMSVLEQTPPELAADIVDNGIVVNGGGSLIPGVKDYFEELLNISVNIADKPLTAVVEGTKVLLQNKGSYLNNKHSRE